MTNNALYKVYKIYISKYYQNRYGNKLINSFDFSFDVHSAILSIYLFRTLCRFSYERVINEVIILLM